MIFNQELEYDWLCSDGGIDMHAKMDLVLQVNHEQGLFRVNELLSATCQGVDLKAKDKPGAEALQRFILENDSLSKWIEERFVQQYRNSRQNLDDDVESEACEKFGRDRHKGAA